MLNTDEVRKTFGLAYPEDSDNGKDAVFYRALSEIDLLKRKLSIAKGQIQNLQKFKENVQVKQIPFGFSIGRKHDDT
jgi:hypothetical protein